MSTYSISELQTDNSLYVQTFSDMETSGNGLGYLYYLNSSGTDPSGFVFELADLDISGAINVDPSFALALEQLVTAGLPDCDATLEFDASLSAFQGLFSFQTDSSDVNDVSAEDVLFRVNKPSNDEFNDISDSLNVGTFFTDLSFSESTVKSGKVNASYPQQQLKFDFVRHLAKEITGGYSSSDIFTNETALVNAVADLDATLGTSFNSDISSESDNQTSDFLPFTGSNSSSYVKAAHGLYNVNLQTSGRQAQLLTDISNASANFTTTVNGVTSTRPLNIPLRFASGDRLAVRIVYHPKGVFTGNNVTPSERSYKVLFRLT